MMVALLTLGAGPAPADYQNFAMTHRGEVGEGRRLFSDDRRLGCARCHTTDGAGGKAGPDLSSIGDKFGRLELVEAILEPSKTIADGFSTTLLRTRGGEVIDGVIKDAAAGYVDLVGGDGRVVRVVAAEIVRRKTTDVSLMPARLYAGLSPAEFADLVEYLASLKQPPSAAAVARGAPETLEPLARPVAFEPFNRPENRFDHPVWFAPIPGVRDTYAVVEHESGKIWALHHAPGHESRTLFADTGTYQQGTRGLLGMAFHPAFQTTHKYYLAKHRVEDGRFATYLLEGEAAADLLHDSGRPMRELIKFDAATNVHYGGGLAFGPDGYLYVGMGDTGPQQDPQGHAQDMTLLLGKVLRIDVDHAEAGRPYAVPRDNPFVGTPGVRPEIWASGFRVPWRFSFDASGALWVGDVGQDLYEEVSVVRRGENHGWNVYEGFAPFSNRYRRSPEHYTPPVFAYSRRYGVSVTGGYVYHNPSSSFDGVYVFGDYESRRLFGLTREKGALKTVRQIGMAPQRIVSFGRGEKGELYLVGYEGTIYTINFAAGAFE